MFFKLFIWHLNASNIFQYHTKPRSIPRQIQQEAIIESIEVWCRKPSPIFFSITELFADKNTAWGRMKEAASLNSTVRLLILRTSQAIMNEAALFCPCQSHATTYSTQRRTINYKSNYVHSHYFLLESRATGEECTSQYKEHLLACTSISAT